MQTITINKQKLTVKEFEGERVVTLRDIDMVHNRPDGTARRNFDKNKKRFVKGVDFFERNSFEAKKEFGITTPSKLILITERGYLMLVKSFTDDLAWYVQREIVNTYFKFQEFRAKEFKATNKNNIVSDIPPVTSFLHGERLVVDVPQNAKIQENMQIVRRNCNAILAMVDISNKFTTSEEYEKMMFTLNRLGINTSCQVSELCQIKPNLIKKYI